MNPEQALLLIEWLDSSQAEGWLFIDEDEHVNDPLNCISVGWLIQESDEALSITSSLAEMVDGDPLQVNGILTIPKCCVLGRTELEL